MKIAVLDDYADAFRRTADLSRLAGHDIAIHTEAVNDPEVTIARLRDADAALFIQQRTKLTHAMLDQLPRLRMISQTGAKASHIDVAACTERGIVISAKGGGPASATPELTWGLILSVLRDIPRQAQRMKDGLWLDSAGTTLRGRTLGIYGFGRIGSMVAGYGKAFGMRVFCWGRESTIAKARAAGFEIAASRDALFAESDVLSLHITLNGETRGLITAADLARMRPDAVLINTSRAPIIAAGALEAALKAGHPGRAAVDVYEDEPVLGASHPLLHMPNVLCTPHLGYSTEESYAALFGHAIDHFLAFAAGHPINVLNPEALRR